MEPGALVLVLALTPPFALGAIVYYGAKMVSEVDERVPRWIRLSPYLIVFRPDLLSEDGKRARRRLLGAVPVFVLSVCLWIVVAKGGR